MKKLLLLLLTLAAINAFGQSKEEVLEKEISFYGKGTVYLENGEELSGKIKHSRTEDGHIRLYTEGEKRPEKYKVDDIVKFTIGDTILFVKVKSITTTKLVQYIGNSDNKIKLYDVTYQSAIIRGGDLKSGHLHPTFQEYWVFFPGMKKAISIKDIILSKKKVAAYVKDCPELSEKITNKERGYKVSAFLPVYILLETYKRISEEYEECM